MLAAIAFCDVCGMGIPYRVWMLSISPPSPHFRWKVLLSHTPPLQREKILTNESGTNSRELFLFHAEYCGNPGTLSVYIGLYYLFRSGIYGVSVFIHIVIV